MLSISDIIGLSKGAMRIFSGIGKKTLEKQRADSLVSLTQVARVEPITMIDTRLRTSPYLDDTLHALVSLFSGYYLQAVALTSSINSVSVLHRLDSLNPNRNASTFRVTGVSVGNEMMQEESYTFGLPRHGQTYGLESFGMPPYNARAALEAFREKNVASQEDDISGFSSADAMQPNGATILAPAENPNADKGHDFGRANDIVQSAPLSVGKMLDVVIEEDGKRLRVPVSVRLLSTEVNPDILVHILSDGTRNITWKERWHGWRSGELELWRDVVLATDLVDEHRRAILKDTSGVYQQLLARRRGNTATAVATATPSLATASNLMVISKQTAQQLERKIHMRLADPATRAKVFQMSYLMILVVVDTEYDVVTFYHRGISLPTTVSVRELKISAKGNGPDVAQILSTLMVGKTPAL